MYWCPKSVMTITTGTLNGPMNNHYIFLHKSNVWVVGRCTETLCHFFSLRVSCMWVPSTDEVLSPSYYNPLVVGCLQVTSTDYVQATVVPQWRWRVHKIMNTLIGHARFGSRRFSFFFHRRIQNSLWRKLPILCLFYMYSTIPK